VLGLPVQHLGYLVEVGKGRLLSAYTYYLRRSHDKLLAPAINHVRILVPHDAEHSLQQLLVRVVTI